MLSRTGGPPTWGAHLDQAERLLAAAGAPAPRADALELLSALLDLPQPALLAQLASPAQQPAERTYAEWIARRARGEALQHITGHLEFMGLDLRVTPDSPLVAPHAHHLVETALRACRHQPSSELVAAEIGTGSGAIALALATLEPRFTRIYALDAVPAALETARANGARYLMNLVINWLDGKTLAVVPEPVDLIVCGGLVNGDAATAGDAWQADDMPGRAAHPLTSHPHMLRPGGALICAVPHARQQATAHLLTSAWPTAQIGFESATSDVVIAVGLLPRGE